MIVIENKALRLRKSPWKKWNLNYQDFHAFYSSNLSYKNVPPFKNIILFNTISYDYKLKEYLVLFLHQ